MCSQWWRYSSWSCCSCAYMETIWFTPFLFPNSSHMRQKRNRSVGNFALLPLSTPAAGVQRWILPLWPSVESFKSRCCLSSRGERKEEDKFHRSPGLLVTAVVKIDGKSGRIWQSTLLACPLIWIAVCRKWEVLSAALWGFFSYSNSVVHTNTMDAYSLLGLLIARSLSVKWSGSFCTFLYSCGCTRTSRENHFDKTSCSKDLRSIWSREFGDACGC